MAKRKRSGIHIKPSHRGLYGPHTVAEEKRDIAKGGKIAKRAQFALNARKWNRKKKRTTKRKSTRR